MNYKISRRAATLSPSLTLAIDSKAKQMKAERQDVVGFGAGEPDFDTPQHIKDAAIKALNEGFTKYTPASGIPELRQAIADKFKRENGLNYKPSQIIVSCGGKHSCYNVILATCEEGDEVIIPAPYWLSYPEMVKLASAKPVIVETTDKTEFKVTPDQLRAAITPRARLFILNSPSNPTSFAQKGAVAALTGPQDHLKSWLAEFDKRRMFAWKKLNSIPGISCVNVKGAFYLFPNIAKTGLKSTDFCARLLETEKVAAVPGIAFGADDYIRLSYATSMANIEKGLERLERFCKGLSGS